MPDALRRELIQQPARALGITLSAALVAWIVSFGLRGPESLPALVLPLAAGFWVLGFLRSSVALTALLAVAVATPLVPFVLGVRNFSLAVIAAVAVIAGILASGQRPFARSPATIPLLVYAAAAVASCYYMAGHYYFTNDWFFLGLLADRLSNSFVPVAGARDHYLHVTVLAVTGIAVYHASLAAYSESHSARLRAVSVLMACGVAVAGLALYQWRTGSGVIKFWEYAEPGRRRVPGTWPDVNSCGTFLGVAAVLAAGAVLSVRSMAARLVFVVAAAACAGGMVLTGSRSALLGVVPAAVVFLVCMRMPVRASATNRLSFTTIAVLVSVVILTVGTQLFLMGVTPQSAVWEPLREEPNAVNAMLKGRLNLWRSALLLWAEAPFLGQGIGTTVLRISDYYDPTLKYWNPPSENAHNYFLQLGAELGWAGLLPFVIAVLAALGACATAARQASPQARPICAAAAAAATLIAVASLTGHPMLLPEILLLFWLVLGLGACHDDEGRPSSSSAGIPLWQGLTGGAAIAAILLAMALRTHRETHDLVHMPNNIAMHALETDENGRRFRWTSGRSLSYFWLGWDHIGLALENPFPGRPVRVDLRLNGQALDFFILDTTATKSLHYAVPWTPPGFATLEIAASPVLNPAKDLGAGDTRDLGVKVVRANFGLLTPDFPPRDIRFSNAMPDSPPKQ